MELPRQDGATTFRQGWLARKVLVEAEGKKGEKMGGGLWGEGGAGFGVRGVGVGLGKGGAVGVWRWVWGGGGEF